MAREILRHCVSCEKVIAEDPHTETYTGSFGSETLFPLCRHCLEFPHRMDVGGTFDRIRRLGLESTEEFPLLRALSINKADRYRNPKPVIIALVLTELWADGGVLLAGKRSPTMKEYPNELALLSGYMEEKHGDWRGSLAAEGQEELCVDIDAHNTKLVIPGSFETAGKGRLMLNWVTVLPGATILNEFVPNDETVERQEIEFDLEYLPEFGIPQHNVILKSFCDQHLGKSW